MHALIIDDEKPVRQAIMALGNWNELGIGELSEAVEGESGLDILRERRPEIVLVDMKMPNMDGTQFLDIASREFPNVKYVVISGYDDFEYAQRAIKAKVLAYLLKPVVEAELHEVLARAVREIQSEKYREAELAVHQLSKPLAKVNLIKMLINGEVNGPINREFHTLLDCGPAGNLYAAAILRIVNFEEVCRTKFNQDAPLAMAKALAFLDDLCSVWNRGFAFHNYPVKNEIFLFLAVESGPEPDAPQRVAAELTQILGRIQAVQGLFVIAGLGPFMPRLELLNASHRIAAEILYHANILDCRESVLFEPAADFKHLRPSLLDEKEMLIYAIENGSLDQARRIIAEYFQNIRNSGFLSLESLRRTAQEFLVVLENIMGQFKISSEDQAMEEILDERAAKSYTQLEEFRDAVYRAVEKIFDRIQTGRDDKEKRNLYEIKDYIGRHYNRDIKLQFFSERYFLSKEYLSKLFREEFGYTIYEYVLKVRMEKARELLSDPDVKVVTASQRLGYQDNNYFSRAFKTYFGVSPTEYKESIFKSRR